MEHFFADEQDPIRKLLFDFYKNKYIIRCRGSVPENSNSPKSTRQNFLFIFRLNGADMW